MFVITILWLHTEFVLEFFLWNFILCIFFIFTKFHDQWRKNDRRAPSFPFIPKNQHFFYIFIHFIWFLFFFQSDMHVRLWKSENKWDKTQRERDRNNTNNSIFELKNAKVFHNKDVNCWGKLRHTGTHDISKNNIINEKMQQNKRSCMR